MSLKRTIVPPEKIENDLWIHMRSVYVKGLIKIISTDYYSRDLRVMILDKILHTIINLKNRIMILQALVHRTTSLS